MQTFLKYVIIIALLVGAWLKHDEINTVLFVAWARVETLLGLRPPLEAPASTPGTTETVPQLGSPVASPTVATDIPPPTPQAPRVVQAKKKTVIPLPPLPDKVWVLRERISVTTDAGVRGVAAGTLVNLIRKEANHWVVADGEGEFEVKPSQVTRERKLSLAGSGPAPSRPAKAVVQPPPVPAVAPGPAPIHLQAVERRRIEGEIASLKQTLAAQNRQLDEMVRANPRSYTLGRATTPQAQRLVDAIRRTEQQLREARARLRSLSASP